MITPDPVDSPSDRHTEPLSLPEGFERGRWWRVLSPTGDLRAETSDEAEARHLTRTGDRLEHLATRTEQVWVPVPTEDGPV